MQQAIAACRAAEDPVYAAATRSGLQAALAECAGSSWLKANTDDPGVAVISPAPAGHPAENPGLGWDPAPEPGMP